MTSSEHTEVQKIHFDECHFDPENPRLPYFMQEVRDETEIISWMVSHASLVDLLTSIAQQGFFDGEPLLGYKDESGNLIIVEGNRRLATVKLLNDSSLTNKKVKAIHEIIEAAKQPIPDQLPVIIYDDRSDILGYLGYRHITGIQSWTALAKAKYLEQLKNGLAELPDDLLFKQLADNIGSNAHYVARLLTTLTLYKTIEHESFFDIEGLNEQTINFSLLSTALSYTNIAKFLGLENPKDINAPDLEVDNLKELSEWIYQKNAGNQTRLGESRNLSQLSAVVDNDRALAVFREGNVSLDEAAMHTDLPDEIVEKAIRSAEKYLNIALNQIPHVTNIIQPDIDKLKDLASTLKAIHDIAKGKVAVKDDFDLG